MGREEKRQRERVIKQLTKKLGRNPNDEEIDKALAVLQESDRKRTEKQW